MRSVGRTGTGSPEPVLYPVVQGALADRPAEDRVHAPTIDGPPPGPHHREVSLLLRRLAWSALVSATLLLLVEGVLTALPGSTAWMRRARVEVDPGSTTTFLCMGGSVTYGQSLPPESAWPGQLATRMKQAGWAHAQVLNAADPGAKVGALHDQLAWVEKAPKGSRVVVLLMIGHNDFTYWGSGRPVRGFGYGPIQVDFGAEGWEPKIYTVLRWATGAPRRYASPFPDDERWFAAKIADVQARLTAVGAELQLLTYPLPGVAPPEQDLVRGISINQTRQHQHGVNDMILHVGESLGIPTIDVANEVHLPDVWTPVYWFDVIHLTREGSAEVARVVADALGVSQPSLGAPPSSSGAVP